MQPGLSRYHRLTPRSRLEKAVNSLNGLIRGISMDGSMTTAERSFLQDWIGENEILRGKHPFNELIPVLEEALTGGSFPEDHLLDVLWLSDRLRSPEHYDEITADLQCLQALIGGIAADGTVTELELAGLSEWLGDHEHLKNCWPYDEIESVVTGVLADKVIGPKEHEELLFFFGEFTALFDGKTIVKGLLAEGPTVAGLCAVCPTITISKSVFCLTGTSYKYTRAEFTALIRRLGGEVTDSVTRELNYLVIGAEGNPCWAYACYGRKVEAAVDLRKRGHPVMLVHERDFHDAVLDLAGDA